ncbi:AsmA-like C-terminal region-containing protein [Sediminimonas sp.]|uniref:AsmA-like C-terminal region-containing protein n=1 Tax=Sediminimonas sp. TaxID=2823379 RepID=UPI0025DC3A49|nr:AsmA-like C-terminal region-containing protein [Sediminimonas sp.]
MRSSADKSPVPARPTRRRRRRRVGLVALIGLAAVAAAVMLLVIAAIGRPLTAPDWLRARIEARASAALPDTNVRFGEVSLIVARGLEPRLRLQDVDLAEGSGRPVLTLSDVEISLSARALLDGRLRPGKVRLSGARVKVRRLTDGVFDLALGADLRPLGQAVSAAQLVEAVDAVMARPGLSSLRSVTAEALTVRYEDVRTGRAWTVDGGRLRLTRQDGVLNLSGDFALLGGRDYATTLELSYSSAIGSPAAQFGMSFRDMAAGDIADQAPALAWLDVLRAPISGSLRAALDGNGVLGRLSATLQIGNGAVQPTEETRPVPFESARVYLTYDPATRQLDFDDISVRSQWVSLRATGTATLRDLQGGWPQELLGQVSVTDIAANPDKLYPDPVQLARAEMDFRLRLDPFTLDIGRLSIADRGSTLRARGALAARQAGWALSIEGEMDAISPQRVLALWPRKVKPRTREWVEKNLHEAALHDIRLAYRTGAGLSEMVYAAFEFSDAELRYARTLPLLMGAAGHAELVNDRFVATGVHGRVVPPQGGALDVAGTSLVVPDVRIDEAPAQVYLRSRSTITAALSMLDLDPINALEKSDTPVALADGHAEVQATLDLRLKKHLQPDEVRFSARAGLSDVRSDKVVPGRVLAAPRLRVQADNDALSISGRGRLGQVPFDAEWRTALGPGASGHSRVAGTVTLSRAFAEEFAIGLPPDAVSGRNAARFEIALARDAAPAFSLSSDLAGLGLRLSWIDWHLDTAETGLLEVAGTLGEPPQIDRLELDAPRLELLGQVRLTDAGQLDRAEFTRARVGNWLSAPVALIGRGPGQAPAVRVTGGWIDMRAVSAGEAGGIGGSGGGEGGPLFLTLERLQVSEGIALTGLEGEFATAGGLDGTFTAQVNGSAQVTGRVVPRDGRSAFRIQSDNAGATFRAAGLLQRARRGALDLTLLPVGAPGTYDGRLKVRDIWLRDAPAMAELLNAASVIGLLEQFRGNGLLFAEVESRFRLTPSRVVVQEGSAVGASLGLSMDGVLDLETGRMDMQGVISPFYLFNAIGAVLTRKGEGLVGFSYRMRGTAENPRVQVNPLSIFTPGMFREIFRRPPPDPDSPPDVRDEPRQPPQPEPRP